MYIYTKNELLLWNNLLAFLHALHLAPFSTIGSVQHVCYTTSSGTYVRTQTKSTGFAPISGILPNQLAIELNCGTVGRIRLAKLAKKCTKTFAKRYK